MNLKARSNTSSSNGHSRFVGAGSERVYSVVTTPVGPMMLVGDEAALVELHLPSSAPFHEQVNRYPRDDRSLRPVADQIAAYFSGDLTAFTVPLAPRGTVFQCAAWNALCSVEYGKTATYGEIAAAIGHPRAARAVGMANHVNPIALIIPCHRIIGANGALTGYAGGLDLKQALLSHESEVLANRRSIAGKGDGSA